MDASAPSSRECPGTCELDRKSTRLNSSHSQISYAVFCLKKNKGVSDPNSTLPEAEYGLLSLDDHGKASCLRHLGHRRHARNPSYAEPTHEQSAALIGRHGFT